MAEYPGSTSRDYTFVTGSGASAKGSLVEIAAVSGQHHCIQRCDFSYSGDGSGSVTFSKFKTTLDDPSNDVGTTTAALVVDDVTGLSVGDTIIIHKASDDTSEFVPITAINTSAKTLTVTRAAVDAAVDPADGDRIIRVDYMLYVTGGGAGPLIGNDAPLFIGNKGEALSIWLEEIADTASRLNVLYY